MNNPILNVSECRKVKVKTWYLKYDIKNSIQLNDEKELIIWENIEIDEYIKLFKVIGEKWGWTGRLLLSRDELQNKLNSKNNEVYLFKPNNETVGFFEIERNINESAEIVYLGLLPQYIGKGFGRKLLDMAIVKAQSKNYSVWLHTCEFDHTCALHFYQNAGFKIEEETIDEAYYPKVFLEHNKFKAS